jgi:hypothetical protein
MIDFRYTCRCTIPPRPTLGLYIPPTITTTTTTKMKRRQEVISRSSGGGILSGWPQHRSYSCYCILLSLLLQCGHFGVDAGWIDLDTPFDKRTTQSLVDHSTYYLVSWLACFLLHATGFLFLPNHLTKRRNDNTILSLDIMLLHKTHSHTRTNIYSGHVGRIQRPQSDFCRRS